jgi:uncharacterized protein
MNPFDTYAPQFRITMANLNPQEQAAVDVISVSVTDTANQADSFAITLRDRNPIPGRFAGGGSLRWIDSGIFDEGGEVEIRLGYVNNLGVLFKGDITAVSASFPESGVPELTVRGFSRYHRLQRQRGVKPFQEKTVSGIAKEIAGIMKLKPEVDPVKFERTYEAQAGETFGAILKRMADPIGYEVVVKYADPGGHTLYFEEPRYRDGLGNAPELEWGKDLRRFTPSLSTYDMVTGVEVRASRTSRGEGKEPLTVRVNAGRERVKMGRRTGGEIAQSIFTGKWQIETAPWPYGSHAIDNLEEAEEVALAQLETKALEFITANGSLIGTPSLKARTMVKLKGLGDRFSGAYYVTSVTHTLDASGYRTDFTVKRNAR